MSSTADSAGAELLPDLVDLDALLRDVPPLQSAHDWAAPEIFPDDAEFEEFLEFVRSERNKDLA
jgi:hypothetical protein